MEVVGYLGDAQLGGLQQERGFHQQHLIDIVDHGAACDLKDEEEDLYWSQGAVELIEKIGTQNWLLMQL